MNKKIFTVLVAAFFFVIAAFHFQLNLNKRSQPPSNEWSKEVQISTGDFMSRPALIKYKDRYIVVHSDGKKIKVISIDKMANKLNEKVISAKGAEPLNTTALTDGNYLYVYWIISEDGYKTVYSTKLDDKFNIIEQSEQEDALEIIPAGESILALNYGNKIIVNDLASGKSYSVPAKEAEYLSSAKNKSGNVVSFKEKQGEIKYFTIVNGIPSELKTAVKLEDISSITYISSVMTADDSYAYLLMEYRNKGEFGGTKEIKFPLSGQEKVEVNEFRVDKSKVQISDIAPYYEAGAAKFLARKEVPYDKKRIYDNIVEYDITNKGQFIQVSRTKDLSMLPAAVDDMVVFSDVVDKDKLNVYIASKNDQFKAAHNGQRYSEVKLALLDTISGILFSFVYIIPYGALWVIPAIGIISVYSVIEYKITTRKKKIYFALIYLIYFILKSLGVRFVSFNRFGYFMPEFMSFGLGLLISLAISIPCGIYAYSKYSKGIEYNVGATDLFMPLVYDTILTLMVFVPFIV